MQGDKSGNAWKTWKEHTWAKRPITSGWEARSWEKRPTTVDVQKPSWAEHSWMKRPTTEEKSSWKGHSWAKRAATEKEEKPKWAEHSWAKRPEEKAGWREQSWLEKQSGSLDKPTTWTTGRQTNCNVDISAKFSAMDAKMDEMTKDLQHSLNMLFKKVEALLAPMNIKNAARKGVKHCKINLLATLGAFLVDI